MTDSSKTARAVIFNETGGPEVLKVKTVEIPAPAAHEVRIRVKAIGINRADIMFRSGFYVESPVFPSKIGYEASGIVEAVGLSVEGFEAGDAVNLIPAFSLHDYGTYGDLINVPAYTLQKFAPVLSFEQAAAIWSSYITAYGLLVEEAKIKPGQVVLINAASSAVGVAAIQVVNFVGGVSIALTSTNTKADALLKAGAAYVIISSEQDVIEEVKKITNGKGANVILDPVGGPLFARLISSVAEKAQVLVYGALNFEQVSFPLFDILVKSITVKGFNSFDVVMSRPEVLQSAVKFINEGINQGSLMPVISKTFPLDQIVEAHQFMETNQHIGKIVVTV